MSKFEKWIIYTICAPIGAILWITAGMAVTIMYDRIMSLMGVLT